MPKKILLIIAHEDFQPVEYYSTKAVLEQSGMEVLTASDGAGEAKAAHNGMPAKIDVNLSEAKASDCDGLFIVGGSGALEHLDNEVVYNLMRQAESVGKLWGAICIAPRILVQAGLLKDKKATGWDGDDELGGILKNAGAEYVKEEVVVDGNLITATGPKAAEAWGQAIANLSK